MRRGALRKGEKLHYQDPISVLAKAYQHALLLGLNPVPQERFEYKRVSGRNERVPTGEFIQIRPNEHNTSVRMFSQQWSSTALGFGGIGGQAFTDAYTVIVEGPRRDVCVYFGGRLAYHIERPSAEFIADAASCNMAPVVKAFERYEREPQAAP